MHPAIETLQAYDIPTGSYVSAVQYLNDRAELTDAQYISRIEELVGYSVTISTEHLPRYAYLYLVQELIRASLTTDVLHPVSIYEAAYDKALEFITENSYIFATPDVDGEPKLDATGAPKPKKGAKKELAKQVYHDEIEGKDLSRKDAIAIIMEKVGMSAGGASTYYANLKSGKL